VRRTGDVRRIVQPLGVEAGQRRAWSGLELVGGGPRDGSSRRAGRPACGMGTSTCPGTSSFGFIKFKQLIEQVLGHQIDLVDYGGLKPKLDDDIRREAVLH
jgi:hypothetical protein